ncbi:hypothetical protein JSE7799_01221 [Jannaschia seosinensis]|uniref:Recombinase n=1 Tax=Jannaschia seosinensis TaxID=313367 RepID=A0A0M7BB70_9RHOB|nr:recombinase family protein [Jannaschia seosinensis]CUH36607.1 hypothetical protein JSE7799_01221 [Jannaschia seosinensis]
MNHHPTEQSTRRVAIYARFSTDMQNPNSTRDQIRNCRELADAKGWQVVQTFEDSGISGSKRNRPAYKKMLQAVKSELVDVVLAEGLDRLNRSQELSANLFSICDYAEVELHTIAEGRVDEMHIGMKGTMDAMQLKRISQETHRGLKGRVKDGLSGGGLSYGYRIPIDPATSLRRTGQLEIYTEEATIVRRIFSEFADGTSPRAIAHQLNADGIPSPRGGAWKVNTIYGNAGRGTGILNNELYAGTRVWNRLRYRENPDTDQRVSRRRPAAEIIRVDVPDLRIVDAELWQLVKARQAGQRKTLKEAAPVALRRRKYLLSGLVRCGCCGGNMTVAGSGNRRAYYCANAKEKGPTICTGMPGLRLDRLQPLVLTGLRDGLLTPEAVGRFRRAFTARQVEEDRDRESRDAGLRKALAKAQKAIAGCMTAILDDRATPTIYSALEEAEARKKALEEQLADLSSATPEITADLADLYRAQVDALAETLSDPEVVHRASEILAELIERITIRHDTELGHMAQLEGKLLGLLGFADSKNAAALSGAACSLKLVAGARFALWRKRRCSSRLRDERYGGRRDVSAPPARPLSVRKRKRPPAHQLPA